LITFVQIFLMTDELKAVSYCVGMSIAGSLLEQELGVISPEIMAKAVKDIFEGKQTEYSPQEANMIIQEYVDKVSMAKFEAVKKEGEVFLAENASKEGVHVTASGLQYEVINEGNGPKPGSTDNVTVHYHGTLIDGAVFDSSIQRGQPATFGVHQVIAGWTEALQLMSVGSKFRLYIPQGLAYGANPHPGGAIKPYSALIFDVELLTIG
jgi:FKBP-type peptidyl-prolyl cis-trans isomerase